MARKGENIYKRKDGRWEARYEKGRNSKGQIIYGSLYGKSYREVREKKINSIVKLPVTKTISPSESVNICDVSTRWLESIRHTVKESTYSCYLTLIQKHILTYFNNSSMITSEHIQQFINYKITNDLSPTSVRNIVVLLERILRYGEDENLLPITKRSFTFPKSSFYINDTLDASQLSILARYLYLEGDAFNNMNLQRVELTVLDNNTRAKHLYEKCGFTYEGRKRKAKYKDGKFVDMLMYSILREEFLNKEM